MKTSFILVTLLLFVILRGFVIILHELGHAISIILLTKKGATIYIGSYGDSEKSIKLKIGSLVIYFAYNPFYWQNGICISNAEEISNNKQIICVLAGPLCSLFFASLFFYITISYQLNDTFFHVSAIFLLLAIVDCIYNLKPNPNQIKLYNGNFTYNDGYCLLNLLKEKRKLKIYETAINTYSNKKYDKAIIQFQKLLNEGFDSDITYRFLISSYILLRQYKEAKKLIDESLLKHPQNSDDLTNAGLTYSFLHFHEKALEFYTNAITINPLNSIALNNKGYTYNLIGQYELAIDLFDKAIEINPDFAYSYNNRGLSKIKTGNIEEGLLDIAKSMNLDPENSYAYKNMGIYYFDINQYSKELEFFKKAKKLDDSTYNINEDIQMTENIINDIESISLNTKH